MSAELERLGPLAWRLVVELPAEELEKEVAARLAELRRTARVPGFRPGKVPAAELRRRFGDRLRREQAERLGRSEVGRVLAERGLRPVAAPRLAVEAAPPAGFAAGSAPPAPPALTVVATFEVFPPLPAIDLSTLEIEVPRVSVGEEDVDRMLRRLPAADAGPADAADGLRRRLAETMESELAEAVEAERLLAVEQALLARHPDLELPPSLVEAQVAGLREVAPAGPAAEPEALAAEARRLLTATFLFAEVARQRGLAPDPARLWERTRQIAAESADPAAELDRIWSDGELVHEIEEELLRHEVAAEVLAEARVTEVETGFGELAERRRARVVESDFRNR